MIGYTDVIHVDEKPAYRRLASSICKRPRTFAEHLRCSLLLLGFVPMHSDSQQSPGLPDGMFQVDG